MVDTVAFKGGMIALAGDHAGPAYRKELKSFIEDRGGKVLDLGVDEGQSVDYPDYAHKLAAAIKEGQADRGILVCGTGIGISIAANRHPHIRAALCHDVTTARLCREHNDANVLVLGARTTGLEVAFDAVTAFLSTDFQGGRHQRRVDKITPSS